MKFLSDKALHKLRSAADAPDLTGTRYRLLGPIALGGMGAVYAAEDQQLDRRVALKILHAPDTGGELANRLLREAKVLASLEHPGIVPIHDVGVLPDGRVFYTMKFVEGRRLDDFIAAVDSIPERLRLFLRICDAVSFAHARGVLHRDLKPPNIMVGSFGEVLVLDWGLAKVLSPSDSASAPDLDGDVATVVQPAALADGETGSTPATLVTGHGTVMGTPGYMSPEQSRGDVAHIDFRSDIYSLGAVLRFLTARSTSASQPHLPRQLCAIVEKAMAVVPMQRYASVAELASDVSHYLDGLPISTYRENVFERAGRFYRRHAAAILLIAAYLFMRALLLFFSHR